MAGQGTIGEAGFSELLLPLCPLLGSSSPLFLLHVYLWCTHDAVSTVAATKRDNRIIRKRRQECKCLQPKAECS